MESLSPVIIVLFVIVVIAMAIYGFYAAAQRRKALTAWAKARGLRFDEARNHNFDNHWPAFKCLREGHNQYAYNILTGSLLDRPFTGFDYHYETYSTDSKGRRQTNHHHFSAAIIGCDLPLKPLMIRPESILDKVTEFFGYDDIDFESAEFSRKFYVKAADKRWAYDVIHARTMQFLLDVPRFTIQFARDCVIVYRGSTFDIPEFESATRVAAGILDALPDYVIQQQREAVS